MKRWIDMLLPQKFWFSPLKWDPPISIFNSLEEIPVWEIDEPQWKEQRPKVTSSSI